MNGQVTLGAKVLAVTSCVAIFAPLGRAERMARRDANASKNGMILFIGPGALVAAFGKCRIKVRLLRDDAFHTLPKESPNYALFLHGAGSTQETSFGLECHYAPFQPEYLWAIIKRDGRWTLRDEIAAEARRYPQMHVNIHVFRGRNWEGVGVTEDAIVGEPSRRQRTFLFCLIGEKQVLCGDTELMRVLHPEENRLKQVLSMLKSIEFIDDPDREATPDAGAK